MRFVTRALIVEPIVHIGRFVAVVYLGLYTLVTNDFVKFYVFQKFIMPIIDAFTTFWTSLVMLFYTLYGGFFYFLLSLKLRAPFVQLYIYLSTVFSALSAFLQSPLMKFVFLTMGQPFVILGE